MIRNITFGSDPEYFIKNNKTGKIISSIPLIKGSKHNPESLGDGYYVLTDNILAEGNIPPTADPIQFMGNLLELKRRINRYLQEQYDFIELYHDDCMEIDSVFLTHPDALLFGCSPYMNAWDKKEHRANDLSSENFRTAGEHIHIGYDLAPENRHTKEYMNIIIARAFDIFVVIPSAMYHFDARRFFNYGGLGQYRDTSYGVECRSLGAFFGRDELLPWVIEQTCRALSFVKDEENIFALDRMDIPYVTQAKDGSVSVDVSIYEDLGLSFENQLITKTVKINADI